MLEQVKCPLGVSPHWFVYMQRMTELNNAIGRYLEYINERRHTIEARQSYELIAQWAKEIEKLAMLEAELERNKG